MWPTLITFGLNIMISKYQTWGAPIAHGLHTQVIQHRRGLPVSFVTYTCLSDEIKHGLPTSSVGGTHQSANGKCGLQFIIEQRHMR